VSKDMGAPPTGSGSRPSGQANLRCPDASRFDPSRKRVVDNPPEIEAAFRRMLSEEQAKSLSAWPERRPSRTESERAAIAEAAASHLPRPPVGVSVSDADLDAMRAAFIRRFDEELPRTETLMAVAHIGYRMALRDAEDEIGHLRSVVRQLTPECGMGCTSVPCPYPQDSPSVSDLPCCVARRALRDSDTHPQGGNRETGFRS
jgi:hypothetical protein